MELNTYNEFCETIEQNAIWLHDAFFVRLTPDKLDEISKYQGETTPESFKDKWGKKIGEVVFLYDYKENEMRLTIPVSLRNLPYYNKEDVDLRLAEKDSLTRIAARKFAQYLFNGHSQIDDIGDDSAIAMMLYLRNGLNKNDFWMDFRKELADGLEELLNGKYTLDIDEAVYKVPLEEDDCHIVDLVALAESKSKVFPSEAFHLVNDELVDILLKAGDIIYNEKEIKDSLGQYVFIYSGKYDPDDPDAYVSKDELRKTEDDISVDTMAFLPYLAVASFEDVFDSNSCETDCYLNDFSMGIALFKQNDKSSADFWRAFCVEFLKLLRKNTDLD